MRHEQTSTTPPPPTHDMWRRSTLPCVKPCGMRFLSANAGDAHRDAFAYAYSPPFSSACGSGLIGHANALRSERTYSLVRWSVMTLEQLSGTVQRSAKKTGRTTWHVHAQHTPWSWDQGGSLYPRAQLRGRISSCSLPRSVQGLRRTNHWSW